MEKLKEPGIINPRPSQEKFVYRNSHYPIYFYEPNPSELRTFHLGFTKLVRDFYKIMREHETLNQNAIVGYGITVGELSLLLIRKNK